MRICVCLKTVPATTADLRLTPDGRAVQLAGVETILNPYDELALEAALKLREQFPGSTIQAVSAGGEDAVKALQHAFSLLADTGVQVLQPGLDVRGAARCIAAHLKADRPDVILCGRQAIDDDQWAFAGMLAELLALPHASAICALSVAADGSSAEVRRRLDGAEQTLSVRLPAVLSCDKGLNEPRAATLKGRMEAKKKQITVKKPADMGLNDAVLAPMLSIEGYLPPPQKTAGKVLQGAPAEAARELVRLLREEAKVI